MKKVTTAVRLKQIMQERNIKQVDILELCEPYCIKYNEKMGKSILSQYVSGAVDPGQTKLTILGLALNVNEIWLMGYDVPRERDTVVGIKISMDEQELLDDYHSLNDLGKDEARKRVNELTKLEQYKNNSDKDDDGETVLVAAREGKPPHKIKLKKRDPNKSIFDVPDYGGGRY